jgi:hypothetical protein
MLKYKADLIIRLIFVQNLKNRIMATSREIVLQQIDLQEKIQKVGFNIVECGNCGTVLLHEVGKEKIKCFCSIMALSDCPDLYYSGIENNEEFNK